LFNSNLCGIKVEESREHNELSEEKETGYAQREVQQTEHTMEKPPEQNERSEGMIIGYFQPEGQQTEHTVEEPPKRNTIPGLQLSEHKKKKYASLALRWGLAIVVLWSVKTKFTTPDMVAGMMNSLGLGFANNFFVILLGITLGGLALWLISGHKVKYPAAVLSLFFSVTLVLGLLNGYTVGPALWKDFGLLGASLSLALA